MPRLYSFGVSLFLLLLLSFGTLFAQKQTVSGLVVNQQRDPLSLATVTLHASDDKLVANVTTNATGQFRIAFDSLGEFFVRVRHVGYQDFSSPHFEVVLSELDTIVLLPLVHALDAVEVNAKKKLLEVEGGTIIYHVEHAIGALDISVLEALKKAPGVYVENESAITLNGQSGVQILIDGRQTYLSGKELTDLLKSLSSNNIKSIEIISSPTAKYDAAGQAGIINIKTKKNQIKGINGSLTTIMAYGVSAKQLQNIALSYRVDKVNIFGSYNHTLGNYNYVYGTNRQQNGKSYDSHTIDVDKRQKMSSQVGMDYYLNDKNTIGFVANGNFIFGGGRTDTHTDIGNSPFNTIIESLDAVNDYYGQGTSRYNFNANYKYEDTLGYSLSIDADYGLFDKWNKNLQTNIYRDNEDLITTDNLYRTLNGIDIDLKGVKLDYGMKLWNGKLEAGLKYSYVGSINDSRFYHVVASSDSLDHRRSNDFHFGEAVSAAYIDYKRNIGKLSLQGGLRVENASSEGKLFYKQNNVGSDEVISRDFTNLFPFFSVSLLPTAHSTMSFSYAKRIDRPAYQDLNPFIYMLDELSFWQGNPFLNPSLTHRLTFLYSLKRSTIVTFNFSYTDQLTAKIIDTLDTEKIVMISKNLGTQKHWSLNLTQQLSVKPWWDMTFNGLLYYIDNAVSFDEYRNFELKQFAGRASLVQAFKMPFKMKGELTAVYNSKRLSGANTLSRSISQVDVAVQKNLLQDRATIRFAVTDIYKGNKSRYSQNFPGFTSSSYGYYESRQARLSFSYRFSEGKIKTQRSRKSALESESGRM